MSKSFKDILSGVQASASRQVGRLPVQSMPMPRPAAQVPVTESFADVASRINAIAPSVDNGLLEKYHTGAHKRMSHAEDTIDFAHEALADAHSKATDPHHKAALEASMQHLRDAKGGLAWARDKLSDANVCYKNSCSGA